MNRHRLVEGAVLLYESASHRRITPWVGRLLVANAVVLLLMQTVFTSESLWDALTFDPALALRQPWTFVTYMFLHGGLAHLLFNSLALFVFGPEVERRLGSRSFLLYYLYCGIGAALFSFLLAGVMNVGPFIGASGAILGVAFAFAKFHPDAEMMVFPVPVPLKAWTLVWLLLAVDMVGALVGGDNIAHLAHVGGFLAGWVYFSIQGMSRPGEAQRLPTIRPRVAVTPRARTTSTAATQEQPKPEPRRAPIPMPPTPEELASRAESIELDRLLDKIGATGMASLSDSEREFLDQLARRRRETE
jgi:membrane associated rhomboid family serine protease